MPVVGWTGWIGWIGWHVCFGVYQRCAYLSATVDWLLHHPHPIYTCNSDLAVKMATRTHSLHLLLALIVSSFPHFACSQSTDRNVLGCVTANLIVSICHSLTPSLRTATAFTQSAPCLCYSSSAWAPGIFDAAHSLCYSYLSTASPAYVASATSINRGPIPSTPCRLAGNVLLATTTATDTSLFLSQTTDVNYMACTSVQNALSNCEILSPGFASLTDPKTQASCICYSGLVWKPTLFDNAWKSCLTFYSTAATAQFSAVTAAGLTSTPCALAGDVRAGSKTVTGSAGVTETGKSSGGVGIFPGPTGTATTRSAGTKLEMPIFLIFVAWILHGFFSVGY